jgi:zinc protease
MARHQRDRPFEGTHRTRSTFMRKLLSTLWILPLIATLACSGGGKRAPETTPEPAAPTETPPPTAEAPAAAETIPLDPAVVHGQLDNGFTYYIRTNQKPEKRAELRLVVNAGSVLEDEDQRGLAHFVEHMAFNGTEHFGKQDLIDYLEGIGMDFGPEINAYTSFDETVYMLTIPTDDEEIVGTAFQILEDWAHLISFEDEEIEKERGVLVEEWRLGRGAGSRIRDKQFPVTFHGSRYAERIVIGDKEILETAPPDTVRRFYRDWYRPDLMAVIAVGDFDAAGIEGLIREHFSRMPAAEDPREREEFPIPDHQETLTSIVTDPEATSIRVTVGYKRPPVPNRTVADMRSQLVDNLYNGMMNDRLYELTQKADPPFQYGYASSGWLGRTKSMYRLGAAVRDDGVERGLETILIEASRVEEYGFQESELERAKVDLLRRVERWYEERDKQESRMFASQYAQHFLEGDPAASISYYRDLYNELVPGIGLAEINARADQWITDENRVILVSGPDTEAAGIPDEKTVLAVFDAAAAVAVTPWVDQVRDEPLVASSPTAGQVVSEEFIEELNVTRWELSNGVTVLLKPTDFKNDEVRLRGYSPGGSSLASDDDYMSASSADTVVSEMGLGNFSQIELGKALAGKVARSRAYISEISEAVWASASPKDLETMFQLLYLGFVAPRRDEESFQAFITQMEGWLENQEASPSYWFSKKYSEVLNLDHPRRQMLTPERIQMIDLDRALAVYRDRFADASDFLFTLVGNFEVDGIRPLVETWLGGLPSTGREETWRDVGVERPEGVQTFEVRRGIEPKSSVRITFHGEAEWSPLNNHILSSMTHALRIRLREVMREDMGGVYGVRVGGGISRYPRERYSITVSFGCDPGRVEELVAAVFAEIETVKNDGPGDENVQKVRESQARERETDLEENRFWINTLEYHERNGLDLLDILRYDDMIEAVTAEALQEAARKYFDTGRYVQGVLYPEEGVETAATGN